MRPSFLLSALCIVMHSTGMQTMHEGVSETMRPTSPCDASGVVISARFTELLSDMRARDERILSYDSYVAWILSNESSRGFR